MKRAAVIFFTLCVLLSAKLILAGPVPGHRDSQEEILESVAVPTDSATLTIQRGPTEAGSAVKLQIKDASGNVIMVITADGSIGIASTAPVKALDIRGDLFIPGVDSSIDCDGSSTSGKGTCASLSEGTALVSMSSDKLDYNNNGAADGYPLCTDSLSSPTIICIDNYEGDWDTAIDCDGTTTTNKGTCATYANDTALVSMSSNKLDFDDNGTADGQPLCTNSLTTPTIVCSDNDNNCANGAGGSAILGSPCSSATTTVTSAWGFVDADADTFLDNGEDLYIDNTNNSGANKLRMTHNCSLGCDANDTTLLGTPGSTATIIVDSLWGFKDDDADSLLDNGEDLYIDAAPQNYYYSVGSEKFVVDTQNSDARVEVTGTLVIK